MKRYFDISFWMLLAIVASIFACSDPAEEERKEEERRVADSTAQAALDEAAINDYIEKSGVNPTGIIEDTLNLRYVVLEKGEGQQVDLNDILTVTYVGKFTDGEEFDTNVEATAITIDSLNYIEAGLDLQSIIDSEGSIEDALDSASNTGVREFILYSSQKTYIPFQYNHVNDGSTISSGLIFGFREGLHKLGPMLNEGGIGEIYIPSAIAYGTAGSPGGIPGNTPLVFEITLQKVRP